MPSSNTTRSRRSGAANPPSHDPSCSFRGTDPRETKVDPDGDLRLKVGQWTCIIPPKSSSGDNIVIVGVSTKNRNDKHEHLAPSIFRVCSKTLSRASPVWKVLLYGGLAESRQNCASSGSDWTVDLPEDDPEIMALILNIIHSRFESVPRLTDVIDLEKLYKITVLTDKYDLAHILRPWASTWMRSLSDKNDRQLQNSSTPVIADLEKMMWISWELGSRTFFTKIASSIASHCPVDAEGNLQSSDGWHITRVFSSTLEPAHAHSIIKKARLDAAEKILSPYTALFSRLIRKPDGTRITLCRQPSYSYSNKDAGRCETLMLGSLIQSLFSVGYWPLPSPVDVKDSLVQLSAQLQQVNTKGMHQGCSGMPEPNTTKAGLASAAKLGPIEVPIPLTESQKRHLDKQAVKSGLR